ncbi:hypothetical protein [Methanobrevibacter millerae]|uniref:Uncharacterized protein n=1 Tax=Methanobrevibacter millerae TaxID=230361 RepID=A0A1G5XLH4_9EURY|nr:hypothetical protein [Methanobrevibacter millerae]SDA71030.1 hypothetical protein SAMN02910315_02341 [Methanobrevibacter millerae]
MANGITKEVITPISEISTDEFNELYKYYDIPNPKEILDFCKIHEGLVEGLITVKPMIEKYFPDFDCVLEFFKDPEEPLDQILIIVQTGEEEFNPVTFQKIKDINLEIIFCEDLTRDVYTLFLVVD